MGASSDVIGEVYVDCPVASIGLPCASDAGYVSLRDFTLKNIYPDSKEEPPDLPKDTRYSTRKFCVKVSKLQINAHLVYSASLDKKGKVVIDKTPSPNSVLDLYSFNSVSKSNHISEGTEKILECVSFKGKEHKEFISKVRKEEKQISIVLVQDDRLCFVQNLLRDLSCYGIRVFLLVHRPPGGNTSDLKQLCKLLGSLINRMNSKFTKNNGKQIHMISYEQSDLVFAIFLSQRSLNTNLTTAIIISNDFDEQELLKSKHYLGLNFKKKSVNNDVPRFRIRTPTLSISLNKTVPNYWNSDYLKLGPNPWICKANKYLGNEYFILETQNNWFSNDIIKWIKSWKHINIQDVYDIDLDNVDINWVLAKSQRQISTPSRSAGVKSIPLVVNDTYLETQNEDGEQPPFLRNQFDEEVDEGEVDIFDKYGLRIMSKEDLSKEQLRIQTKFYKLDEIQDKTLPKNPPTGYDNLVTYFQYMTYSLFLEELYHQDFCSETYIKKSSDNNLNIFVSTKQAFELYVQEEIHHLRKHPFVKDQPLFIIRKSDESLCWKNRPQFWVVKVKKCEVCRFNNETGELIAVTIKKSNKRERENAISMCSVEMYNWNEFSFPKKDPPHNFTILPGSIVLGRIFDSMSRISNPTFIDLILGKTKIKSVSPKKPITGLYSTLNDSQKTALNACLSNEVTVIQGPPGSGKTSTIHETVIQLLDHGVKPVMVVASSNLAVDNIAEKMIDKYKDRILRVCSTAKEREYNRDHKVGSICLHNKLTKQFSKDLVDIENRFREDPRNIDGKEFNKYIDQSSKAATTIVNSAEVIFTTTASILHKHLRSIEGVPVIIMDEATQSSEPLTMIALGVKGCRKLALVGDTEQLSVFTNVRTLKTSLYQRVIDHSILTKPHLLNTQYRMHPEICEYSNTEFYKGQLRNGITAEDRRLKKIKFPLFFYDHQGNHAKESRIFCSNGEEQTYSWINTAEVGYVVEMVENLIRDRELQPSDIGVMTGYSAQRELLINAFKKSLVVNPERCDISFSLDNEDLSINQNSTVCDINGLIIASIDAFQGRERKIVVMSCVRSNSEGNIGFMADHRRMNVAITRAQYSFVMVGNFRTFSKDVHWGQYLLSLSKKGYVRINIYDY